MADELATRGDAVRATTFRRVVTERWPNVQAALRGESPVSQQTSPAVERVRMLPIDDTPEEDGT